MSYKFDKKRSPNNDGYGVKNQPECIVVHHWGKDGQSFDGVVNWLCNPKAEASAHYVLEEGRVMKLLNFDECGWHTGDFYYNTHSIGIECRPEMTDGDLQTLIELIANIYRKMGRVLPIKGHKDIVPTACPGRYYDKLDYIEREAKKLYKPKQKKKKPPVKKKIQYNYYCDYITNMGMNFRTKPDADDKYIITVIPKNTRLKGTINDGWLKTTYKGRKGYVKVHKG